MVQRVSVSAGQCRMLGGNITGARRASQPAPYRAQAHTPSAGDVPALGAMPEAALRCLIDLGLSNREIARYFGLHVGLIERLRRDFGLDGAALPGGAA